MFVDAGCLYAEGGKVCRGSAKRDRARLIPSAARDFLADLAFRASGVEELRRSARTPGPTCTCSWNMQVVPSDEVDRIDELPHGQSGGPAQDGPVAGPGSAFSKKH